MAGNPNSPDNCPEPSELQMVIRRAEPEEMQIVPANNNKYTTPFELPSDWLVEVRPRGPNSPWHSDKYYYEPGTGLQFRSLASVRRHLNGEKDPPPRPRPQEMQIVPASSYMTPPELPSDWVVEVRPRGPNSSVSSDKYYYEPGTGRKFRSLVSVRRYLNGEEDPPPTKKSNTCIVPYYNSGSFKRVIYGGKVLRPDELEEARYTDLEDIYPETSQFKLADTLPDGWIVEEVPRKCGLRSDRYFIEPTTGQRFRSMPEVQRFLKAQRYKPKRKALTLGNKCTTPRISLPRKKNTSINTSKDTLLDLMNPPTRINWVYSGDGKDKWSPLVEECALPNYVIEQWSETFLLGMNGRKHCLPQLTMVEANQE